MNQSTEKSLLHKSIGMFVGLAVGDALGAPVEFGWTAERIRQQWSGKMQDHLIPAGHYTDDTAMALCLADSLIECGGYNSYDVMTRYMRWATEGYRDSKGFPASDIGIQTANAIEAFVDYPVVYRDFAKTKAAGNRAIMRLAPVIVASVNLPIEDALELARISSRETHYSDEADAGAEIFAAMLWNALYESDKKNIIDVGALSSGEVYDDILQRVFAAKELESKNELEDLSGYIVDALKIAVWGFMNFGSFEEGMLEVIKLGGDTDTNAAIYGQLAGAYYGYESIPQRWLEELLLEPEIRQIASELYKNQPNKVIMTRFESDSDKGFFHEFRY